MATFTIRDETVHDAFDTIDQMISPASVAKAMRERREDERRAAKAKAFLDATGNVAERDAKAILSDEYKTACERYYVAIEADEEYRATRSKCEAVIEAWRTVQSNQRAMGRIAA
jgi:ATP:corrinoid adenosyltransferase